MLRALLVEARAILCDEPTSSLDARNADQVMDALNDAAAERAIVWVTHDLDRAARVCASRYVFLSAGRMVQPGPGESRDLHAADPGLRRAALGRVAGRLAPSGRDGATPGARPAAELQAGRAGPIPAARFAGWTANAISTLDRAGRWPDPNGIGGTHTAAENRLLRQLDPAIPERDASLPARLAAPLRWIWAYRRPGLTALLFLTLVQVFLGALLHAGARAYRDIVFSDPAVARISFEYLPQTAAQVSGDAAIAPLGVARMRDLGGRLEAALADAAARGEIAGEARFGGVYGRHTELFAMAFSHDGAACGLGFVNAAILDPDDPVLGQVAGARAANGPIGGRALAAALRPLYPAGLDPPAQRAGAGPGLPARCQPGSAGAGGAGGFDAGPAAAAGDAVASGFQAVLTQSQATQLLRRCPQAGPDATYAIGAADMPGTLLWQVSEGSDPVEIGLRVAATAERMPSLYPFQPGAILFAPDYNAARACPGVLVPDPAQATAYIPVDGFAAAQSVLEEAGYGVLDDTSAAIDSVARQGRVLIWVALGVVALNAGAAVLSIIVILNISLELNRRVLTLFRASGFAARHIFVTLVAHVLPALGLAAGLVALVALGMIRPAAGLILTSRLPELATRQDLILAPLGLSLVFGAVVVVVACSISVLGWWRMTRRTLPELLKD